MADYSEAIQKGIQAWMDAHSLEIKQTIEKAVESSMSTAIEMVAAAVMLKVGKFLDETKPDLLTGIAAAVAASWNARQRPSPPIQSNIIGSAKSPGEPA